MSTREDRVELAVDREVQKRLGTDPAYRFAENADEQADREREIEEQVCREMGRFPRGVQPEELVGLDWLEDR